MDQSPTFDDYADRLRSAREALDDDRTAEALDVFLEIRESGVFSDALDRQIQALSQQPDPETIEGVRQWIDEVIDQIERRGGDVFSRIEEVSETVGGIEEQSELVPLSESSDVGIELMELSEVNAQGEGFFEEGGGVSVETSAASSETGERSAFSRESEPITAVGHDDLSDYESDDVEEADRSMEGADADFERLPSVDFAVVDSEDEEHEEIPDEELSSSSSTGDDVTEGLQTDEDSFQSNAADLSDESTSAQSEGGGEFDVFGDGGDIASSFSVDEQEDEQEGESSGFSFEPESSPGEISAGGIEDIDFDEGFGEESEADEESDGFVFESEPEDEDDWSGFGEFESEPTTQGTEAGFDFGGQEEADDDMFGESGLFGGGESDESRETRKQDAVGVDDGEDDFDFGFGDEEPEEEERLDTGGGAREEIPPAEPQDQDPNQTRQPFSDDREVEAYAQNSVESPDESVGPDRRSDSLLGDGGRNLKESGFPDAPDEVDENEKTKGPFDKESHTPVGQSPSPPPQEEQEPEEGQDEGFDLGFENPGGDDAAGFELEAETGVGPSDAQMAEMSSPTPVPGEQQEQSPAGMNDESTSARRQEEEGGEGSFAAPGQPRAEGEAGTNQPASPDSEGPSRQVGASPDEVTSTQQGIDLFDEEETGSSDPLSDDEFFQLADELSEPESAGGSSPKSPPGGSQSGEMSDGGTPHSAGVVEEAASSRPNSGPAGPSSEPADAVSQTTHGMPAGGGGHMEESGESNSEFEEEQRATSQPPGSFIYDAAGESADESSAEISGGAIRLIEEAERLVGEGNLDSAHDVVQSVLDQNPESERAQSLLDAIEEERGDDEPASSPTEKLGSMDNVPEREISMGEVANRDLDHRYGFILSLVDGQMTIDDILELSSMSRSETLDVLSAMLDESIISLNK